MRAALPTPIIRRPQSSAISARWCESKSRLGDNPFSHPLSWGIHSPHATSTRHKTPQTVCAFLRAPGRFLRLFAGVFFYNPRCAATTSSPLCLVPCVLSSPFRQSLCHRAPQLPSRTCGHLRAFAPFCGGGIFFCRTAIRDSPAAPAPRSGWQSPSNANGSTCPSPARFPFRHSCWNPT